MTEQQPAATGPAVTNVYVQAPDRRGPNHVLHGILSVLTGGVWLPVWAIIAWRAGRRR